jgi:hypothetical protein
MVQPIRKTPYNTLKDNPKGSGLKSFKQAVSAVKDATGMSYEMLDTICRLFARELADSLVQNKVLDVPNLGTFYFSRKAPDFKNRLLFKVSPEFMIIYNNRGTDENNFIRTIKKSSFRNLGGDGGSGENGE